MELINGHGRENSDIMVVADYPSTEDIESGQAISGKWEARLRTLFAEQHYNIRNTYRTLYIKAPLSYTGKAIKKRRDAIIEAHKVADFDDILFTEIKDISPNVIVPLGDLSLKILTGVDGIRSRRGSILALRKEWQYKLGHIVRVIPTLSPQHINEDYKVKAYVAVDFKKIVENRTVTSPILEIGDVWICDTVDKFRAFVQRHLPKAKYLTFDVETFYGIPSCISFCFDGWEAISVPLFNNETDSANGSLLLYEIDRILRHPIPKINQNIKFDVTILERFGFKVHNITGDTQLAAGLIYPELPKRLEFLTSLYTDMPYYKDEGRDFDPSRKTLYLYNAKDALSVHQIHTKQEEELKELGLFSFYVRKVVPWLNIYLNIDRRGIKVDLAQRDSLIGKYKALKKSLQGQINELAEMEVNTNSPMQVGVFVYEKMKYPIRRKQNATGRQSYRTDAETIEDLWINHPEDNKYYEDGARILKYIIACRKIDKILQYLAMLLYPDNCMRTTYNLTGTETGRTSSSKLLDVLLLPNKYGKLEKSKKLGIALQTIPKHGFTIDGVTYGKDIRSIFVPRSGYVFIESDLSQAEARVDAVLSESFDILPKFDTPPGIHCLTASWVYNCSPGDIKKGTEEYQIGKTVRHAGERNMKPDRLSLMIHKNRKVCANLLDKFHKFSPNIRTVFHEGIRDVIRNQGYLISPQGRRRDFFNRLNEQTYNEAISTIPQATVSDRVKESMITMLDREPWIQFIYEGHDAHMAEVPEDKIDLYCKVCKEEMEQPIDFNPCSLSRDYELLIPTETEIGTKNWLEMVPYGK